jgi:undecaprenyl diphosphate synthase
MHKEEKAPLHVAIIMDGNGRWAQARGQPRAAGHQAGATALRRVIEAAPSLGITMLSVYAFSIDNWRRPRREVDALMALLRHYLQTEVSRLAKSGIRFRAIGRRDRLPAGLAELIVEAERVTSSGAMLDLRLAIDYSGRDAILDAINAAAGAPLTRKEISRQLARASGGMDIDLLIRTSGEQRLSDFMLWEAAYAELYFTNTLWPDFGRADLEQALSAFRSRERRFGSLMSGAEARSHRRPCSKPLTIQTGGVPR